MKSDGEMIEHARGYYCKKLAVFSIQSFPQTHFLSFIQSQRSTIPKRFSLLSKISFFLYKMMLIFLPLVKNRCRCFYSFIICCIISRKRLLFCQDSSFFVRASHNFFMTSKSLLLKITI